METAKAGREVSKNGSQNDRANRFNASRLLRNLALQLLGPAVNHRTYIAGVWPHRVLPLQCVSCKLERFFLLMHVALVAISSRYTEELNPQDIGLHRELACKAVKIGTERPFLDV